MTKPFLRHFLSMLVLMSTMTLCAQVEESATPAAKQLDGIMAEFYKSVRTWKIAQHKKQEDAKAAATKAIAEGREPGPIPAKEKRPSDALFALTIKKLQTTALSYKGKDEAVRFYTMILQLSIECDNGKAALAAVETLTQDHIRSKELGGVTAVLAFSAGLIGQAEVDGHLQTIATQSPHARVRAQATIAPLWGKIDRAPTDSKKYRQAKAKALKAAKESGDEKLLAEVQASIDGREKLVVGTMADDIHGVDLDGTHFKLSDYKGKVVLLDFWGDW